RRPHWAHTTRPASNDDPSRGAPLDSARARFSVSRRWSAAVSGENGLVAPPLPGLPVLAGGKPDPRLAPCLSRIPHLVAVAVLEDDRAVHIVLPIGLTVGAEDDDGLAPPDAILAFDQGNAFLGSPREPQAVGVALLQNGDVEAGSQIAAQNRVLRFVDPSGRRLRGRCVRFVGPDTGQ